MGKQRTRKQTRNRMNGGGLGQGYQLGTEMLSRGYAVVEPYGTCGAVSRAGMLAPDQTSTMAKGLPGITGGGKRRSSRKSRRGKKQRGGRYEAVMSGAEFEALGPRGGMMATAGRTPCEAGQGSPLPSPTAISAPVFKGGAQLAPAPFLQEQTAGYTQMASKWLDSVGAPIQLHEPVGGRMASPACGQTGGKRSEGKRKRGGKKMHGGDACQDATDAHSAAKDAHSAAKDALSAAENVLAAARAAGNQNAINNAQNDVNNAQTAVEIAQTDVNNKYELRMNACAPNQNPVPVNENPVLVNGNSDPVNANPVAPAGPAAAAAAGPVAPNPGNLQGGRRKASRKNRKTSRKASRKNRKASHKNRK